MPRNYYKTILFIVVFIISSIHIYAGYDPVRNFTVGGKNASFEVHNNTIIRYLPFPRYTNVSNGTISFIVSTIPTLENKIWSINTTLDDNLNSNQQQNHPAIAFNITHSGVWESLVGLANGAFAGRQWYGGTWHNNASLENGIATLSANSSAIFITTMLTGNRYNYLIASSSDEAAAYFYNYGTKAWVKNNSILNGVTIGRANDFTYLYNFNNNSKHTLFQTYEDNTTTQRIIKAYTFENNVWVSQPTYILGLPNGSINYKYQIDILGRDNETIMFLGVKSNTAGVKGSIQTYVYNGASWSNSTRYNIGINNSLTSAYPMPSVIYDFSNSNRYNLFVGDITPNVIQAFQTNLFISPLVIKIGDISTPIKTLLADSNNYSVSINNSIISSAMNNRNCNCNNCTTSHYGYVCNIPFYFNSTSILNVSYYDMNIQYYQKIILWDEISNSPQTISTTIKTIYFDELGKYFNINTTPYNNFTLTNSLDNRMRYVINETDGQKIIRYIDAMLIPSQTIRICSNHYGVSHNQQILLSTTRQPVLFENQYANCYIAADYTRFAYQDSLMLSAYTINSFYSLYNFQDDIKTLLANYDGSLSAFIDIAQLEFRNEGYNFGILSDGIGIEKVEGDTAIEILYENLKNDNTAITATIINMDDRTTIYYKDNFDNPNNFDIVFNYGNIPSVTNSTLFQLQIEKTNAVGTSTFKRYFNIGGRTSIINSGIGLTVALFLILFGLTFTKASTTFSWFGLFMLMGALAILSITAFEWYIGFMMALCVILMAYIVIVMLNINTREVI